MAPEDYCELCDLPRSQCIHGMPAPAPEPPRKPSSPARSSQAKSSRAKSPRSGPDRRTPPRTTPNKRPAAGVSTRTSAKPRRWTPPPEFVPHILAVLEEAGGSLETEEALERLEERLDDWLKPGDRERTPQGVLRWHTAARKARRELVGEGVLSDDQPGVWKLR